MTTDDLVSVRSLVDSDFDIPVRECDAIFAGYDTAPASGYEGTRVNLNYKELDNVVCVKGQVYNLPNLVLNMGMSNKHKSRFGYYGDSLGALNSPDEDIKDWSGQSHHLVFCDGQDGRPEPKPIWNREADPTEFPGKMVPTPVWVVTAVGGVTASAGAEESSGSAAEWAEENLTGGKEGPKTRAQFNKWAFADPKVRKDTALQRTITDKSFINSLVQLGKVHEDTDGIFQAGPAPVAEA